MILALNVALTQIVRSIATVVPFALAKKIISDTRPIADPNVWWTVTVDQTEKLVYRTSVSVLVMALADATLTAK